MEKLIIVDHSLQNLQGHHYECSVSIAEAAIRMNYKPIIIAAKNFSSTIPLDDITIIPACEVDWFNQPIVSNSVLENKREFEEQDAVSWHGIINKFTIKKDYYLFYLQKRYPSLSSFIEKVKGSTYRLQQWMGKDLSLLKTIPGSNTIWGLLKILWGLIVFLFNLGYKILKKIFLKILKSQPDNLNPQTLTETLFRIFPTLEITANDHVFIHTIGIEQLEELYYFLQSSELNSLPLYHILLRRDTEDSLVINAGGMSLAQCLQAFYDSQLWSEKIRFYTDTEDLVRRHNALSPIQFTQIPIPFRQEKLQINLSRKDNQPIHIVYLGDARPEKGYQHLPYLVESLWQDYLESGKVKFTIQSNYNIQGGDSEIIKAKLILAQYPNSKVKLIDQPMLPNDYYQLLATADIVVLPYNAQNYQRSSGVLTEALAAGKPVVVPAGSWLAKQVNSDRASIYSNPTQLPQSVIRIIENLGAFTLAAQQFSSYWKEKQSPDRLLRCLFQPPNFNFTVNLTTISSVPDSIINSNDNFLPSATEKTTILLIMAGESLLDKKNVFAQSSQLLTYFCQCGYQVYGVFYAQEYSQYLHQDIWDKFVQQVKQSIQSYRLKGVWVLKPTTDISHSSDFDFQQYINDTFSQRQTLLREWVESNQLDIPKDLIQTLQSTVIDTVYLDSVLRWQLLNKLGQEKTAVITEVSKIHAYHYAFINQREIDKNELVWEIDRLKKCQVLIAHNPILAEKIRELVEDIPVYTTGLSVNSPIGDRFSKSYEFTEVSDKAKLEAFYEGLNKAFNVILKEKFLPLKESKNYSRIAVLYPWGNIQERNSGASQRTGLLLDFLKDQFYEVGLFTIGSQRSLWQDGIYYDYYEPPTSQESPVQEIYVDAYRSWSRFLDLQNTGNQNVKLPEQYAQEENTNDWLPWIYYRFRFDPDFQNWLEKITDWAEVIILEYPFWADSLAKICHRKKIPWLLTSHDVLSQNIPSNTTLGQISLAEELHALRQADAVITLSPNDQAFFQTFGISSHCVPIGIDTEKVQKNLQHDRSAILQQYWDNVGLKQDSINPFCLFVGSQHRPNIEAVKRIRDWSEGNNQSINFVIVGECWEPEVSQHFLSLGKVEEDILIALYQQTTLVLAPLTTGTGMSVKILEAMAYGKVILGTAIAFRGYPIESGVNAITCDILEDYPLQIEQLLHQPEELERIGKQAQVFSKSYDYRQLYKTYLDLIR